MKPRPLPPHTKLHSQTSKKVFSGVRFDVYQWEQKRFDGSIATFEMVKRNDTVIIIPIVNGEIVIVKEQQPHWDNSGYALVAGGVEPDEDLEAAARRELEEETGYIFDTYELVHIETNTPAVEWFAYTYIAYSYRGTKEKNLDPGEKNEVVKISVDKLIEMTRKVEFRYRPRFIEDMLVQDKETELRKLLDR